MDKTFDMNYIKQTYEITLAKKPYLFIGSKIRGAFGYALKDEVCVNPSFRCQGCFAQKSCVFYTLYELQNTTHPYRLDFKLHSKNYKFSLLLFEELQKHSSTIQKAMMNSLKDYKNIHYKEKVKKLKLKKPQKVIKLEFLTPIRLKKQNRFLTKDVELLDILLSIHRRKQDLKKQAYKKIEINKTYKIISKHLHYQELVRKSNKQNTTMNLGGLMGEMIISNITKELYELLKLGEVIGVGKSTVFGLGKIKVEDIN